MILLISEHVISLQNEIVARHTMFSSSLMSKNSLLIYGDYSFKAPAEFKKVFKHLGITEKYGSEEYKKFKKLIPEIKTKEGTVKIEHIELSRKFNDESIKYVANILTAMFDGYEVENYINILKMEFEKRLNNEN